MQIFIKFYSNLLQILNHGQFIYQSTCLKILLEIMKQVIGVLVMSGLVMSTIGADWSSVDAKIGEAISKGHFPGCVLGVYNGSSTYYKKAYGTITPKWGLYSAPTTLDTRYDLNYLTQVVGINAALMQMYDLMQINVTDKVSRHFFDFDNNGKRTLTIQNMLLHNSGTSLINEGLQQAITDGFGNTAADLYKKINTLKLQYKEETKFWFSQLGFIVLGEMIAKMNGKTLEQSLFEVMVESGMRDTKFKPNIASYLIAPSGYNKGISRGTAGNSMANFLGSTSGNAGLYSTLDNVAVYMQTILNRGKLPIGQRVFTEEVIELFTAKVVMKSYKNTRALGWDTVPDVNPPCGKKFSAHSFGMSDITGSYIWGDKDKNVTIVLLANGQFPSGFQNHATIQGEISDAIMTVLGY